MGIEGRDQEGNWVATARKVRVKSWEHGIMKSGKKVLKKVWGIRNVSNTARKFSKIIPGID